MTFSNTTTKAGIIQQIEYLTDLGDAYISGDTTRLRQVTATVNRISSRVWHLIFMSNGNWQYDDSSYTDLPSATTDIVSGTASYALPSDALTVQRVEAKDAGGIWQVLTPITKEMLQGQAVDEFMKDNGALLYYRLTDGTIELFPASNYASSGGLKVYFDRGSVDFAYDATTATPGFASPYHEILPIGASIEWLKIKQPNSSTLPQLQADYLKLEKNIKEYYGARFKDLKPKIGRNKETFR